MCNFTEESKKKIAILLGVELNENDYTSIEEMVNRSKSSEHTMVTTNAKIKLIGSRVPGETDIATKMRLVFEAEQRINAAGDLRAHMTVEYKSL